jgi:hypothetical protein
MITQAPLFLEIKIKGKDGGAVQVNEEDILRAAASESKTIFPQVDGGDVNNIEKIAGLTNITLTPSMAVTAVYTERVVGQTQKSEDDENGDIPTTETEETNVNTVIILPKLISTYAKPEEKQSK